MERFHVINIILISISVLFLGLFITLVILFAAAGGDGEGNKHILFVCFPVCFPCFLISMITGGIATFRLLGKKKKK